MGGLSFAGRLQVVARRQLGGYDTLLEILPQLPTVVPSVTRLAIVINKLALIFSWSASLGTIQTSLAGPRIRRTKSTDLVASRTYNRSYPPAMLKALPRLATTSIRTQKLLRPRLLHRKMSTTIPIIVCGQREAVGSIVIAGVKPEVEGLHYSQAVLRISNTPPKSSNSSTPPKQPLLRSQPSWPAAHPPARAAASGRRTGRTCPSPSSSAVQPCSPKRLSKV